MLLLLALRTGKGGGSKKRISPQSDKKAIPRLASFPPSMYATSDYRKWGGQKIKMRPTGRIWGTVVVGRTNKGFFAPSPPTCVHGGSPPPLPFPSLTYISYKKYHEEASSPPRFVLLLTVFSPSLPNNESSLLFSNTHGNGHRSRVG